jgi:hypothetical protein
MPVALLFENPKVTKEQYDAVRAQLGAADFPDACILHLAGPNPAGGWRVFEVWESEEAARDYIANLLVPVFREFDREAPSFKVWPLDRVLTRAWTPPASRTP